MRVFSGSLAVTLLLLGHAVCAGEETPSPSAAHATLQLAGGYYLAGELLDCQQADIVRWQGSDFVQPFDFAFSAVSAVQFPSPENRPTPKGQYCLELDGGDLLFGSLAGVSAQHVDFQTPGFGLLHLQRSAVRRILHWRDGADPLYIGPNGLSEWDEPTPKGAWRQDAGQLITAQSGAMLVGDFGIPAQACIEFELSWTSKPDFLLAFGTSREQYEEAFRLEVWGNDLVLLRETKDEADLASLQQLSSGAGRCHFSLYLDQQRNRAVVAAADGTLLATLEFSNTTATPQQGLRLVNRRGNVRLEQLRISRWSDELPGQQRAGNARLHRLDGSAVSGAIEGFDASTQEFLVAEEGRQARVPADAVASVMLSPSGNQPSGDIRAVFQDGTRLRGKLRKVEGGRLWLDCAAVVEPLGVRLSELRTLVMLQPPKPPSEPSGRQGRLEAEGLRLFGCLQEGSEQPEASCLVWHPQGSTTASPLKHGVSGRIIYRAPSLQPSPEPSSSTGQVVQGVAQIGGRLIAGAVRGRRNTSTPSDPSAPPHPSGPTLYLRNGDTIPCRVERIDERGITFHSPLFEVTSVTHDKVRAVELENPSRATKIDNPKRDRLMTLPRMQKTDPPTHLIRSTEGDYVRARLIEMDDKTATVEVRLETRHLPRERITRIIWLDPKAAGPPKEAASATQPSTTTRVQALRNDGIRLAFVATQLTGATLQGTSEVLGACRVALGEVDQLLIGGAIQQATETLPYQRWKLQPALEPKFAQDQDGQGSGAAGTESALVGKPAPEFELETLGGPRFRLREQRGKIVVLDFSATWCGPCIQTLPQVVEVVKQYENRDVILVAVNLQESPEAITALLERLKLQTTVALDHNGTVAQQYAAVAIPQTVIIDAQGNVARVLVGGGPQYADPLRDALQSVLTSPTGQAAPHEATPSEERSK